MSSMSASQAVGNQQFTLDQIPGTLSSLYGGSLGDKKKFVEWLAHKDRFPQFIQAILADSERLQTIADRSFPHKNGFDMLQLFMTEKYELRCHIWPETQLPSQENIHNHRWDLASRILVGTLKQDFFEKIGEEPVIRTFLADPRIQENLPKEDTQVDVVQRKQFTCQPRTSYFKDQDAERVTSPYKMTQIKGQADSNEGEEDFIIRKVPVNSNCAIQAGGSYSLEQTKFHRVCRQKGDPMTATVMLNTGPYAPFCRVFTTRNLEEAHESRVRSFTVDEVRSKLEGLLKKYLEQNA